MKYRLKLRKLRTAKCGWSFSRKRMRIFLIGFMGSGKTTVGETIALKLGYSFIDMDRVIEEEAGMTISQIFDEKGEDEFRRMEHELILRLSEMQNIVVSTGGGVPCFYDNMDIINKCGISIYLKMTPEDLLNRLKGSRFERPLIRDLSTEELEEYISKKLEEREPFYLKSKHAIDGTEPDIPGILNLLSEDI
jgi:shikimate kinase